MHVSSFAFDIARLVRHGDNLRPTFTAMANVRFELTHDIAAPPEVVWRELIDWKGHEAWVVSTHVDTTTSAGVPQVGDEFTAWTGPAPASKLGQRVSLEDRMRVDELDFDDAAKSGSCKVTKLGPVLTGWAAFAVSPHDGGTQIEWTEDVVVRYAPQLFAPVLARIGIVGFRLSLSRLAKQLRSAESG